MVLYHVLLMCPFGLTSKRTFGLVNFLITYTTVTMRHQVDMVVQLVKPVSFSYSEGASVLFVESNEEQRQHKEHIGNM